MPSPFMNLAFLLLAAAILVGIHYTRKRQHR
jgi:hypothetical protein